MRYAGRDTRDAVDGAFRVSRLASRALTKRETRDATRPFVAIMVLAAAIVGCTGSDRPAGELRFWTDKYALRVSSTPVPPRARSRTLYRVEVRDKESGRPMERVEGQIYASNSGGRNIYDALEPGPELGPYYATLNFITAEEWALNLRFRGAPGDSIEIAAPDGWRQVVGAASQ